MNSWFARVVKGEDLRSSALKCAWVRTPQPAMTFFPPHCTFLNLITFVYLFLYNFFSLITFVSLFLYNFF
jgi:hypothetical protein